jgi:cystathionine beta-synthase
VMMGMKNQEVPARVVSVEPATLVRRALEFITGQNISQLPVITKGECVGHVTEATLMARVVEDPRVLDHSVQELMDPPLPVVDAQAPLDAVTRLLTRQNPAVLVRRDGALAGIITRFDVLRYLVDGRS